MPLPLSELSLARYTGVFSPMNTYFYQVYNDNRWWISRYQTFLERMILTIYVDVDIVKRNHVATAMSRDDKILIESFKFLNDANDFQLLISKLNFLNRDYIIMGLETTSHYGDNLVRFLVAAYYRVCILNPL